MNNNNPNGKMEVEELLISSSISSYSQTGHHHRHHGHQQQPLMLNNPTADMAMITDELEYNVTPPFLTKTYELVDDQTTNEVVSWSKGNNSFIIWDVGNFSINILPRYFKHNNFSSFVRQLSTYGFRKVELARWEFANEDFLRGHKHLLGSIKRKKQPHHHRQPSSSQDQEIERLRHDKKMLMAELGRMRHEQRQTKSYIDEMELRLQMTEYKQQELLNFWSKALQNTNFLEYMIQVKDGIDLDEAIMENKKRKSRPVDDDHQGQCSNHIANGHHLNEVQERSDNEKFWDGAEDEIDVLRLESENVCIPN